MKKKRFGFLKFLVFAVIAFLVFSFVLKMFTPSSSPSSQTQQETVPATEPEKPTDDKNSYEGFGTNNLSTTYSSNWQLSSNVGKLDMAVAPGVRAKRTDILGSQKDRVTIMVYMCGSDLESQAAMGVRDLQEMANAKIADNVNLIVYTGGTTKWHTDIISNRVNQIYQVVGGGKIGCLVDNAGTASMVDPSTLTSFIEFCTENFEANRYELILWDHGGGSISGYGYDEKYPKRGSMSLGQLDSALTDAGVEFDFIGFDACLMATTETALMLSEHADYLIGSEESEPGIGWYYTNWLSKLSNDVSMPTVEIGKNIADDFVSTCSSQTPNQTATLSVVDLAEVEDIVPQALSLFSKEANQLIDTDYREIAMARKGAREFAAEQALDLVDLVDLASKIDSPEAQQLCQSLMSAVKYNNTSRGISNAYGLSIYFPYRSAKYTGSVLKTYDAIDMSAEYSDCIRSFATYQTSGQVSSGGQTNPYSSITSSSYSNQNYANQASGDLMLQLLELFLTGDTQYTSNQSYTSYYDPVFSFLFGRSVDTKAMADYIAENHFDADLNWKDGKITLTDEQWELVDDLKLNVFVEDEDGYIDLGTDNVFLIDENGSLRADKDFTWLGLSTDGEHYETMPYTHIYTVGDQDDYTIVGRAPIKLNGEDAWPIIVFTDEEPNGFVAGVSYPAYGENDYPLIGKIQPSDNVEENLGGIDFTIDGTTAVTSDLQGLKEGDQIQFICDHYAKDGSFDSAYALGEPLTVTGNFYIGDLDLSDYKVIAVYEFTDIYQQHYWTAPIQ